MTKKTSHILIESSHFDVAFLKPLKMFISDSLSKLKQHSFPGSDGSFPVGIPRHISAVARLLLRSGPDVDTPTSAFFPTQDVLRHTHPYLLSEQKKNCLIWMKAQIEALSSFGELKRFSIVSCHSVTSQSPDQTISLSRIVERAILCLYRAPEVLILTGLS